MMSVMGVLGEINIIPKKVSIEWKIEHFFSLSREDGVIYSSPAFSVADNSWSLDIRPNGDQSDGTDGFIDLLLCRLSSGPPISVECSLGLKTVDGGPDRENHLIQDLENSWDTCSTYRFISRFELLEKLSELVPADILTVVCTLECSSLNEDARSEKLSNDLNKMMKSGDHSDTTIIVKGEEFRLHMNILGARNPVFNSMFKSDMRENITGVVSIDDCEPDTFHSFINFIYTGKVDELSEKKVCDLYILSDKYQEEQLKEECLEFMMNNIDYDTFFDFVVLALKHDEKKLLQSTTGFFCVKVRQIIQLEEWQTFLREYPTQANQLYIKAADYLANLGTISVK